MTVSGVPSLDFDVEDIRGRFPDEVEIMPLEHAPDAEIPVPGSKSVTNRAILVAALARGPSTLVNPLLSDDSFWLMNALHSLRVPVRIDDGDLHIQGQNGIIPAAGAEGVDLFVGNAGTVARFLPPALAFGSGEYRVDGVARMRERPIADLVGAMRDLGVGVEYGEAEGVFPLVVCGGGMRGGVARVAGGKSSQFVSGVMLSAPYADRPVTLEVTGERVRQSYVGITRDVMRSFGVDVEYEPANGRYIVPRGAYAGRRYPIEPDASGASYFLAAAALTGGRVRVPGLGTGSGQGDMKFVGVLRRMGCGVEVAGEYVEVRGPEKLRGVDVDMNDFSDTMITLAAIAPFAEGVTRIRNVAHARHQETDRIHAVATELQRLGVRVIEFDDGLEIHPGKVSPARVHTYKDHRIAMAFSLIGLVRPGISIHDPSCVTKTMPDFFDRLDLLRGAKHTGDDADSRPDRS